MLTGIAVFAGCKDYSADAILWINDIETGAAIETIKSAQPDFIEIKWNQPDTINNKLCYRVTLNGSENILNKTHSLIFINGRFQGCSHNYK